MKLSDFSKQVAEEQEIDEAGGIIDREVLSRFGTKLSKTKAQTRVTDKQRAEALWDSWLEVTGGTGDMDLHELVSWLDKEVRIDGVNVDMDIIKKALKDAPFMKELPQQEPEAPAAPKEPAAKEPAAKEPEVAPAKPEQAAPKKHPAEGGFVSLDLPALNSGDKHWQTWADQLSNDQPQLFVKLAKALGAKISTTKRKK